jgi:TM2 domain-containing membrane protein YozV
MTDELGAMSSLNEQQRLIFMHQMSAARKSDVVAILLAFFLGSFGAHRFYLGQTGWGILYLLFCWTLIPHLVSFVECFLLPGRVRSYNAQLAYEIAARIKASYPGPTQGEIRPNLYPA